MKLATKRKIDHWVGLPALIALNAAARGLGAFLKRNHSIEPVKCILVLKFQGMGSLAIAKDGLAHLRAAHPDAKILFWGTAGTTALARLMPEFDEVIELNDRGVMTLALSMLQNLRRIWSARPDWVFDLEVYSKASSILATLSCGRNRTGFALESVKHRYYTHTHLVFFNRYEYLGVAYRRLLGLLLKDAPVAPHPKTSAWKIPPQPSSERASQLGKTYIVVNLHSGELAPERKWPREYFQALILALLEARPDLRIVLVGKGPEERRESESIQSHPRLINLTDQTRLDETIQILAQALLVITADTGTLHLATLTPTRVLALFGPTRGESYFPPARPGSIYVQKSIYCSPCVHHWDPPPCMGDNQCMKQIRPSEVFESALSLLGEPHSVTASERETLDREVRGSGYYPGLVFTNPRALAKTDS